MNPFWISDIQERNGERTVFVNPLPQKHCTFDCVFCPIGERTAHKTDNSFEFEGTAAMLQRLEKILKQEKVDKVYILPDGEALANTQLEDIIKLAKQFGCKTRIITNGYMLNNPIYKAVMLQCDEVIGELMTVAEEDFQKLQRPLEGYTLQAYVDNMLGFRNDFKGEFNLSITVLKGYSDSKEALEFYKAAVHKLKPHNIYLETPEEGKLQQAFGVTEDVLNQFEVELNKCSKNLL